MINPQAREGAIEEPDVNTHLTSERAPQSESRTPSHTSSSYEILYRKKVMSNANELQELLETSRDKKRKKSRNKR